MSENAEGKPQENAQPSGSALNVLLYFRCGFCGNPTDKHGTCLSVEEIPFGTEGDWNKATMTNGNCCPNGDADHFYREPTEEMLKDGGMI